MCVNKDNTSEADRAAFEALIDNLSDGPLRTFLTSVYNALADGATFCLAAIPAEPDQDDDTPPPGIYPV